MDSWKCQNIESSILILEDRSSRCLSCGMMFLLSRIMITNFTIKSDDCNFKAKIVESSGVQSCFPSLWPQIQQVLCVHRLA